jgi:hypothetical protein
MKFKPGQSGNPKVKAKGTLHKATRAALELLDGEAESITRKAIEKAIDGDSIALRLCLERLIPARKDRSITIKMPRVKGAADLPQALQAVMKAVAIGEITPGEGQALTAMLEDYRKSLELAELEARIKALEERELGLK